MILLVSLLFIDELNDTASLDSSGCLISKYPNQNQKQTLNKNNFEYSLSDFRPVYTWAIHIFIDLGYLGTFWKQINHVYKYGYFALLGLGLIQIVVILIFWVQNQKFKIRNSKSEMGNQKWGRQKNALILNPDFCHIYK